MRRLFLLGVVFLAAASMAAAQEKKEGASSGKIHGGQVDVISAPDGTQGQAVVVINPPPWSWADRVFRAITLILLGPIAGLLILMRGDLAKAASRGVP
jgi:hypothetical protein